MSEARSTTFDQRLRLRAVANNFSWLALASVSRQLAFLCVNALLISRLSSNTFGILTQAYCCLMVSIGLSDFGLWQVGWNEIAREPKNARRIVADILLTRMATASFAIVFYLSLAYCFCENSTHWLIFALYLPGLLFNSVTFNFYFLARNRTSFLGRQSVFVYFYYAVACYFTVGSDNQAWLVPVHFVMAHLILFIVLWRNYRLSLIPSESYQPTWNSIITYLAKGWRLAINSTILRLAANYPILLISILASSSDVACFRAPEIFVLFIASFGDHLGGSYFSEFSHTINSNEPAVAKSIERCLRMITAVYIPTGFLFIVAAPVILARYTSNSPEATTQITVLLGLALYFAVSSRFLKTCMPSIGLSNQLWYVTAAGVVVGISAGIVLLPKLGVLGMAIAVLLAEALSLGMLVQAYLRRLATLQLASVVRTGLAGFLAVTATYFSVGLLDVSQTVQVVATVFSAAFVVGGIVLFEERRSNANVGEFRIAPHNHQPSNTNLPNC